MRALDLIPSLEGEPVLSVRALRKSFARGLARAHARTFALRDVDLTLFRGEVVCVAGDESAGKTALLQCVAGLLKRDGGSIKWFGETVAAGFIPRDVAYVPAVPVYYPFLTVRDVMHSRLSSPPNRSRLTLSSREILSLLELDSRLDVRIADLSRPEIRCVSIAEAIVQNPLALLLDTAPVEQGSLSVAALSAIRVFSERGGAVMMAVRDAVAAADAATRIIVLNEGCIRRTFYWDSIIPTPQHSHPLLLAETLH
jgi:ABC-type multidrug transport system ATPase subunit